MLALRYAAVLAIAVWTGGLLALGAIVAPAVFDVVALRQVAEGRVLSGAIFGEAFRRFHLVAYGCGAVLLLSLVIRRILGPRPRRFAVRFGIATLMLAASLYSGLVISTSIATIQQQVGPGVAVVSLAASDPRRVEFGRLHAQSTLIQLVPLLGGALLVFWELRD
jgi:hypothetical protein